MMERTIQRRKRSEPHTFEQRLEEHRVRLEIELSRLPAGTKRKQVVARMEQLRTAAELNAMLSR
jgi:predicted FMN-binding regulatory protein PaiB